MQELRPLILAAGGNDQKRSCLQALRLTASEAQPWREKLARRSSLGVRHGILRPKWNPFRPDNDRRGRGDYYPDSLNHTATPKHYYCDHHVGEMSINGAISTFTIRPWENTVFPSGHTH